MVFGPIFEAVLAPIFDDFEVFFVFSSHIVFCYRFWRILGRRSVQMGLQKGPKKVPHFSLGGLFWCFFAKVRLNGVFDVFLAFIGPSFGTLRRSVLSLWLCFWYWELSWPDV